MTLNRRAFVQWASLAVGAMGVGGGALLGGPAQYAQALGKPTRRKLALLIGINQYPDRAITPTPTQDVALKGCLTDVEMQRQLLIHRFGFLPQDILTLTNQAATRQGIVEALEHHLVQQAQGDDVVVLHFSGYGSQVRWVGNPGQVYQAWVPVDGYLPSTETAPLTDLLEGQIAAILRRMATPNLTTVLDGGGLGLGEGRWGYLRVRSRPGVPTGDLPSAARVPGEGEADPPWPGLLLRASAPGQVALEGSWDGVNAGLFTYTLTQGLWETIADPNPKILVQRLGEALQRWTGPDQGPMLGNVIPPKAVAMPYSLLPECPNAVGILEPVPDHPTVTLWLGGMAPEVLHYLQGGSQFVSVSPTDPTVRLVLRLESRLGLYGVARPVAPTAPLPTVAQPLYESVRLLPQAITLGVALDGQLKRVERVDATSALAGLPFVTALTPGDRQADCLFGHPSPGLGVRPTNPDLGERWVENSYGLFAPNRTPVLGTLLAKEEAVKTALARLTPNLRALLALKLVRLTENRLASGLAVLMALEEAGQPKANLLLRQQTEYSRLTNPGLTNPGDSLTTLHLPRDTRLQYRLTNRSDVPLDLLILSFDNQGECSALIGIPAENDAPPTGDSEVLPPWAALAPRQTRLVPSTPSGWGLLRPASRLEIYLIFSARPLQHCRESLAAEGFIAPGQTDLKRVRHPLKLAQALLQDLHSDNALPDGRSPGDVYALDHSQWATFTVTYR